MRHFRYIWTINNLHAQQVHDGELMRSPKFDAVSKNWFLSLFVRPKDYLGQTWLSVFLNFLPNSATEEARVTFSISILDASGTRIFNADTGFYYDIFFLF